MRYTNNKRVKRDANFLGVSSPCGEKSRNLLGISINNQKKYTALVDLIQLMGDEDDDFISSIIEPGQPYTIGRSHHDAQFIFADPRVSKQHCQILFDALLKKLYLLNGALLCLSSTCCNNSNCSSTCVVDQFRDRLLVKDDKRRVFVCSECRYIFKASLNGLFVNGVKVSEGLVVELSAGDEVMLVCGNRSHVCGSRSRIGFIVRRIVFQEEVVIPGYEGFQIELPKLGAPLLSGKVNKRVFALRVSDSESPSSECDEIVGRAKSLSACCKRILHSNDPVSFIRESVASYAPIDGSNVLMNVSSFPDFEPNDIIKLPDSRGLEAEVTVSTQQKPPSESLDIVKDVEKLKSFIGQGTDILVSCEDMVSLQHKGDHLNVERNYGNAHSNVGGDLTVNASGSVCVDGKISPNCGSVRESKLWKELPPPPGKNFYLNRLESLQKSSPSQKNVVTLPELLHPVESLSRIFIATFTSDIGWFLSYCDIPSYLPVTVACHNTERCWSGNTEMRSSVPCPDFPNLVAVYPPFPETIAFGNDRKRKGVGCHHPKLLVLQREDTLRVIITSANLNSKQWNDVTNTIWWQDFPRRKSPDCAPLFNQIWNRHADEDFNSDFAAQLAGFMATLVTDVPSQANWIFELTKYDFTGASAYLVASVPGIHSYKSPSTLVPAYKFKCGQKFLGSVEASVVGLSHLFRTAKDSNGVQLKKLATYLAKASEKECEMSEVILRRDKNVPVDANAVSVLVPNPMDLSKGDCVQLGFLPRAVAKWVSPLWDIGFLRFSGYILPREALTAAFGEDNLKVQLILYVFQGPNFKDIPKTMEAEHVIAFCSLLASIQRCTGLWRLEEVLHQHKWPEHLESDFSYGSSSIGTSVNAHFLAAFSAASGKRSRQLFDSEESDPQWGCWDASHELEHPSLRIIFPTIERVKSSHRGILPSKCLLCFQEKTWQRLKTADILHDAIPNPSDRVGYPMHVKVARRRFRNKKDTSSFGWVYSGSHNMSAAAWGQVISRQSGARDKGKPEKSNSSSCHRLHICNYELGLVFVFPPPADVRREDASSLDDICLPFVMPAPKYGPRDRPATMRAMSEASAELAAIQVAMEEVPEEDEDEDGDGDEDEVVQEVKSMPMEVEEEKAYVDALWSQVESS